MGVQRLVKHWVSQKEEHFSCAQEPQKEQGGPGEERPCNLMQWWGPGRWSECLSSLMGRRELNGGWRSDGWWPSRDWLHHISKQPVPMYYHYLGEVFPNIQPPKPSLTQLGAITCHPITFTWEKRWRCTSLLGGSPCPFQKWVEAPWSVEGIQPKTAAVAWQAQGLGGKKWIEFCFPASHQLSHVPEHTQIYVTPEEGCACWQRCSGQTTTLRSSAAV